MTTLAFLSAMTAVAVAMAAPEPVSEAETHQWLRQLLPLPKEIELDTKVTVPVAAVRLQLPEQPGELILAAGGELQELLGEGIRDTSRPDDEFTISLHLHGAEGEMELPAVPAAETLKELPNSEQAYVISPTAGSGLALAALDERGLYYACKTLQQLLRGQIVDGRVTVPLVTVRDWPDLAERGEWGGSANADIEWLAERKMNLVESHVSMSLDEEGRGVAKIDETLLERGRKHAVKVVPIITHLDQLARSGIYDRYPELKGVGESAKGKWSADQIAPCFSQPKMPEILADWFASLASQEGVTDVCVWLSEAPLQCGCEACQQEGQFALEAKAAVRGWELAHEKHPHVKLRILLTQGSYSTNDKVLAVVPPEVGVTYYDGGRTYDSSREPMIYPLLEDYAAQGRWLGCYPQLTASWRIVCPWSGPQFIRFRMTEFVEKGLKCLCGYATPNNRLYDFNIQAAAEWSWNSRGRDEHEFAAAWATREGLKDPEKAADWAVMLGPVGWDVYGARVPYSHFFGAAAKMVRDRAQPKLGEGMFRYIATPEGLDERLATCDRALALAEELEAPTLIAETQTIQGYVRMMKTIWQIASTVAGAETLGEAEDQQLQTLMNELDAAALATTQALEAWEAAAGPGLGGSRFADTVQVTEQTSADIGKALTGLGITDPGAPYRPHKIGGWEDGDFRPDQERITKRWEVTEAILAPGPYEVRFDYSSGWWGLHMYRVALASAPAGDPEDLSEVVVDEHEGTAAHRNENHTYRLELQERSPDLRYFIIVDIQGTTSEGKPENRRGCAGDVWLELERPSEAP
jgi:hypothetical protein